jgi:hypothetical protein
MALLTELRQAVQSPECVAAAESETSSLTTETGEHPQESRRSDAAVAASMPAEEKIKKGKKKTMAMAAPPQQLPESAGPPETEDDDDARDDDGGWVARVNALPSNKDKAKKRKREAKKGLQVLLHIYDVSQDDGVHKINKWLAHKRNPLKFGGIFHAGVEINGLEWSFGMSDRESVPGISCCEPRSHPQHRYRETVVLKRSKLSAEDVSELMVQLLEEYPGHDYDLLRRNCCHFADDFCRRLGAGGIPGWVHRLARVGAGVDTVLHTVLRQRLLQDDDSGEDYD